MSGQHRNNSLVTVELIYRRVFPGVTFIFSKGAGRHRAGHPPHARARLRRKVVMTR